MEGIPHHMIGIVDPDEEFSVARFQKMVEKHISAICQRGRIPIIVGGTGLYIRSVLDNYDFSPPGGDRAKREEFLNLAAVHGNEYLFMILEKVDPAACGRIHPNDTRRLVRALEVYHSTGRPISEFRYGSEEMPPKYNLLYYGLTMNRENLYKKIEQRVDLMLSRGLIDEVKCLVKKGFGLQNTSMQALGYKEIAEYLNGRYSLEEAVELVKRNTRRFAKRQMTWFRREDRIKWKDVEKYSSLEEIADEIVCEAEGQFSRM